jgi:phosphoglycolate phosphatase
MGNIDFSFIKHIIWDWNGTLLNDLDLCLGIMNSMLRERDLPTITKQDYLEIFGFPVKDYYRKLGYDFNREAFEDISTEFITAYEKGRPGCRLFSGAVETLSMVHNIGLTQSILSASKRSYLIKAVKEYGLQDYFTTVLGLGDHHAGGKLHLAREYLSLSHPDPYSVLLIGDTVHDAEIAEQLGIGCLLIPNGHHSRSRLAKTRGILYNSLYDIQDQISKLR